MKTSFDKDIKLQFIVYNWIRCIMFNLFIIKKLKILSVEVQRINYHYTIVLLLKKLLIDNWFEVSIDTKYTEIIKIIKVIKMSYRIIWQI